MLYCVEIFSFFICACRGYKRFFRRTMLESSDFLKDDCLKFNCTVGVVVSAVDAPRHFIKVPESDIGSHFGMLLERMEGSDATFNVAGETFAAHKLVLAARSPKFRSKLFDSSDDDKQEIVVTDLEPKVFKVQNLHCFFGFTITFLFLVTFSMDRNFFFFLLAVCSVHFVLNFPLLLQAMLHFIYRDALTDEVDMVPSTSYSKTSVTETLIAKLLAAADNYGLERLKLMCESRICKDMCVNSVADILTLADHCHAAELKAVCLKFAAQNLAGKFVIRFCFIYYVCDMNNHACITSYTLIFELQLLIV